MKPFLIILVSFFLFFLPQLVQAESVSVEIDQEINTQNRTQIRREVNENISITGQNVDVVITRKVERQITGQTVKARICERTAVRINERLERYETNKDKWTSRHQGVVKRLTGLADKLETRGCDVSVIRSDIQTYEALVTDFAASFRDFQATLQGARAYVCSESKDQFSQELNESKQKLNLVRENAQKIQTFFNNSLKPHLNQAAKSCPTIEE